MENLFSSLVYFGLFQGIFLLFILFFKRKEHKINQYVIFLIIIITIGLLGRTLLQLELFGYQPRLITISEFSMLLFGPSIALFVRSTIDSKPFKKKDLWHFIPATLHIIYLTKYFILVSDETLNGRFASGELIKIVLVLGTIGIIYNLIYWIWSCIMYNKFKSIISNEVSYAVKFEFLRLFLIIIGLCLCFWFSIIMLTFFKYQLMARVVYSFVWLSLTLTILFLGFYLFTQPEIFNIKIHESKKKYSQSKLTIDEMEELKKKLGDIMIRKKPYLNKKLLKNELAELMGVSNPEMSRLLNESIGMNFFEYVNYYRIKEFIALAKSDKALNLTFYGLAQEAGFNSKTTFNKSFKKLMGMPPRDYFSSLKD
jgi:AraC-like DNA-binding protein